MRLKRLLSIFLTITLIFTSASFNLYANTDGADAATKASTEATSIDIQIDEEENDSPSNDLEDEQEKPAEDEPEEDQEEPAEEAEDDGDEQEEEPEDDKVEEPVEDKENAQEEPQQEPVENNENDKIEDKEEEQDKQEENKEEEKQEQEKKTEDNQDKQENKEEYIQEAKQGTEGSVVDDNVATESEIDVLDTDIDLVQEEQEVFGAPGYYIYIAYLDSTNTKQIYKIDDSPSEEDLAGNIERTITKDNIYADICKVNFTDETQLLSDYDDSSASFLTNAESKSVNNIFNSWDKSTNEAWVVYYPKEWTVSFKENLPTDGNTWSHADLYISESFNYATDMTDSSAYLPVANSMKVFHPAGARQFTPITELGLRIKGSKKYFIKTTTTGGETVYKRLAGFATTSGGSKNDDYGVGDRLLFWQNSYATDFNMTTRHLDLYSVWEDYTPYNFYVVYKNGAIVEMKHIISHQDPALFAQAMNDSGTGYNGWYLMQDGGAVDEASIEASYDPDHARDIASNADLQTTFTNWKNDGDATKNIVFGASYAPIPDPTPAPTRGGGTSGGGSGGGGDLGINNAPDKLNQQNNIPQLDLINNEEYRTILYQYNGNSHNPFYNVQDTNNFQGYGTWQKWPLSNNWLFHCGDPKNTLSASGYVYNGWYYIGLGTYGWYHFNVAGVMDSGWYQDVAGTYYLNADPQSPDFGKMLTGTQLIDGRYYNFGADGRLIGTR